MTTVITEMRIVTTMMSKMPRLMTMIGIGIGQGWAWGGCTSKPIKVQCVCALCVMLLYIKLPCYFA